VSLLADPQLWQRTVVYAGPLILAACGELLIGRGGILDIGMGALAALSMKSNKIGLVGGVRIPDVIPSTSAVLMARPRPVRGQWHCSTAR
jgi:ABC-type uncharacterized transport system permease subunit